MEGEDKRAERKEENGKRKDGKKRKVGLVKGEKRKIREARLE